MTNIMLRIRALYEDMGRGEKKIAEWILNHQSEMIGLSISDLAERCGSGEATIVRFARRLGLSGYQELKISIAREAPSAAPDGGEAVNRDSTAVEIFAKVSRDIYRSLEHTKKVLNGENLERAVKAVAAANRIAIFGLGNSAAVAIDARHKFLRAGLNAAAYCDNHMQAIAACHLSGGDVAIGISHSGSSRDVVEALKLAREAGAETICVTNFGKSPILKQSDTALFTASEETKHTILGMNSRIAQLAIIDAVYMAVLLRRDETAAKAVEDTEKALLTKKY